MSHDKITDHGKAVIGPHGPSDRWYVLSLLSVNYFTLTLHRLIISFIQPPMIEDLQLTDTQVGWLQPAFLLPYAVAQLFVAYLGDRYRRRSVLLASLSASVLVMAAMSTVNSFTAFVLLRVLLGVGQSASVPAIASMMADCFPPRSRSTAVSVYLISYTTGIIVAGRLGGRIADTRWWTIPLGDSTVEVAGWRMSLLIFSGIGLLVMLLLGLLLREPRRTEIDKDVGGADPAGSYMATVASVLRVRSYLALVVIFLLVCTIGNTRDHWLARYFHDSLGMTLEQSGWFSTIWMQSASLAGLLLGGLWADWWARRWLGGRAAVQLIGMALWIPSLAIIGSSHGIFLLAFAMVVFGIGQGFYIANLWTTTFEVVPPAARATATGLLNFGATGSALAGPVVGYLYESKSVEDLGVVFAWLSVVPVLLVLLLALYIKVLLPRDYDGPATGGER